MKIDEIDKAVLNCVRSLIEEALKSVNSELEGATISLTGGGTYCAENATIKLELALEDNGKVATRAATDYKRNAKWLGLPSDGIGKVFKAFNGKRYRITGLKPRSKKYPVLAEDVVTGKTFKFPAMSVTNGLEK